MKTMMPKHWLTLILFAGGVFCWPSQPGLAFTADIQAANQAGSAPSNDILVEIFLASEQRPHIQIIKQTFEQAGVIRFRPQFFRLGHPPENIAIGKNVPAEVARVAIRLATQYNRGVKFLLPEYRFFPHHIAIGTSAFDEASQIPIRPEDLERLSDPTLTTAAFHDLYRTLTGEDQGRPTYPDRR